MSWSKQGARVVNPWIVVTSVMLAAFMEVLDTTVVNVSLPYVAGSLSASVDEAAWALTAYLAANAIIIPLTGWLANYVGRKRLLLLSISGFAVASLLCGLAPDLPTLVLCRTVQGACGGALQPISLAVALEVFPLEARAKAMAFIGLGTTLAPMSGPVLGGWLTSAYSWRLAFFINIPISLFSIIMISVFVFDPVYIRRSRAAVDLAGIGLLAVGVGSLQIVLDRGEEADWFASDWIVFLSLAALIYLGWFIARELRTRDPICNLRVFVEPTYAAGVLVMTAQAVVLYGSLVLMPLLLQTLLNYPALQAGWTIFPRGLGAFVGMLVAGRIPAGVDPRRSLTIGLLLSSVSLIVLSRLNLDAGYWDFFWPQLTMGFAFAFSFVPIATITMSAISKEGIGNASSIFQLMRNLGGSVGIAGTITALDRLTQEHTARLSPHFSPYNAASLNRLALSRSYFRQRGVPEDIAFRRAYAHAFQDLQRHATMLSANDILLFLGALLLFFILLVWLLRFSERTAST